MWVAPNSIYSQLLASSAFALSASDMPWARILGVDNKQIKAKKIFFIISSMRMVGADGIEPPTFAL